MAKQKGILSLVGTIGEINFYYRNGKAVARKAGGGFNGEAIKTKASMVRVRENNSEFGNCSRVKKNFRIALYPFLRNYHESTLHGRMMQLFQQLKDCDTSSERGKREVGNGILTTAGKELFRSFQFTPKCLVTKVVPMKATYDTQTCVYHVADFDNKQVRYPKNATHVEMQFGVLGVDFEKAIYTMFMATPLFISKQDTLTHFSLVPANLPDTGLERFAFIGITFYQEVNGVTYVLKEDGNVGLLYVG